MATIRYSSRRATGLGSLWYVLFPDGSTSGPCTLAAALEHGALWQAVTRRRVTIRPAAGELSRGLEYV